MWMFHASVHCHAFHNVTIAISGADELGYEEIVCRPLAFYVARSNPRLTFHNPQMTLMLATSTKCALNHIRVQICSHHMRVRNQHERSPQMSHRYPSNIAHKKCSCCLLLILTSDNIALDRSHILCRALDLDIGVTGVERAHIK